MSGSGRPRSRLFGKPSDLVVPLSPLQAPAARGVPRVPRAAAEAEAPAAAEGQAEADGRAEAQAEAGAEADGRAETQAEAGAEADGRAETQAEAGAEAHVPPPPTPFSDFDEPTLLGTAASEDPHPEWSVDDESEPTVHDWPEPRGAEAPPAAVDDDDAEPAAIADEVEEIGDDHPSLPWNRPLVPVRRNHVIGRFGGACPPGAATSARAGSVAPSATAASPAPAARPSPPAPAPAPPPVSAPAREDTRAAVVETSAPGKVILLGEHAVVYGHRAIAAAVSLTTTVTLTRRPGPSRVEQSSIQDPRLAQALATVVPAEGIGVAIRSTLPAGCGMGSSAALAVAVVRALARLEGREASLRELVERGFELERVFHGNPSGLDHTVSASGGALLFRREAPAEELRVARPLRLVIANTGTPSNTAEMVEGVRRRNPTGLVMRLGALAEMAAVCISRGEPIGHFLREAHRCLRLMGVSTPQLDDLCRAMESAGAAGAKLSGAGGGGIALALVDERTEEPVRRAVEPLARGGVFVAEIAATPGRR